MKYFISILFTILIFKTSDIMECSDFEKLLGKKISNLEEVIGKDFENKYFEKNYYYIKDETVSKSLNGISFNSISVQSDEKEIVESITIHFLEIINQEFYDQLIQLYDLPNEIKIIEKKEEISNKVIKDETFSQEVKKSNIELRDGSFEENPLYVSWKKENFNVKLFFRHKQGISEITFTKN